MSIYSGDSLEELQELILDTSASGNRELVFEAEQNEEYAISVGRKLRDNLAYSYNRFRFYDRLNWGNTPDNDRASDGTRISNLSGQITGTGQYATTEPGRSLAPRLFLAMVHVRSSGNRMDQILDRRRQIQVISCLPSRWRVRMETLNSSSPHVQQDFPEKESRSLSTWKKDRKCTLRIGNAIPHSSSSFTLQWESTDAPHWLRYLGRVSHGRRDASGQIVSLSEPSALEMSSDGTLLFVSTETTASSFTRDAETGGLSFLQELDAVEGKSYLLWDPYRERLYANNRDTWWTLEPKSTEPMELELSHVAYGVGGPQDINFPGQPSTDSWRKRRLYLQVHVDPRRCL